MKKQMVRLTESELNQIIEESVKSIITENMKQEGWFDNMKAGTTAFFNSPNAKGGLNLKRRVTDAKKNYSSRGQYDELNLVLAKLKSLIESGKIDANTTVGQLVGSNTKFGKLGGMAQNQASQMSKRGYKMRK
jgi:hypothetical protein